MGKRRKHSSQALSDAQEEKRANWMWPAARVMGGKSQREKVSTNQPGAQQELACLRNESGENAMGKGGKQDPRK